VELTQLPNDHLIGVHARRVLLDRLLRNGPDQLQQVLPYLLRVRGRLPLSPALGEALGCDEHRATRDRVAIWAAVRVIAAVRPERVFDLKTTDCAEVRLWVIGMFVTGLALVSGVKPARSAAVRSTIRHAKTPWA